jgi:hypothetical protein
MNAEPLVSILVAAVPHVLAAATLWYARAAAQEAAARGKTCKTLLRLRNALTAIADTGRELGARMTTHSLEDVERLGEFVEMLEEQNSNINAAKVAFVELGEVFDVKAPELSPLLIHLHAKARRIEVLYVSASRTKLKQRLQEKTNDNSQFYDDPREISPLVESGEFRIRVEKAGRPRGPDQDFAQIVALIPTLDRFIDQHCPVECLT